MAADAVPARGFECLLSLAPTVMKELGLLFGERSDPPKWRYAAQLHHLDINLMPH